LAQKRRGEEAMKQMEADLQKQREQMAIDKEQAALQA